MAEDDRNLSLDNQVSTEAANAVDPVVQDQLAPWRSPLSHALHRNRALAYARYGQLATVRADGRPANRTVVFRGFLDQPEGFGWNGLKFICDRRSSKVNELDNNPWAEFCWYFPKTREQFRLAGTVILEVGLDDNLLATVRAQTWEAISTKAQASFYWPEPGEMRAEADAFRIPIVDASLPSENFVLLVLQPERVDHLELRGDPQHRWQYKKLSSNHQWTRQTVNP